MTFIEKELKILHVDPVAIIAALEKLGAKKQYDKTLYDVYFDTDYDMYGDQKKNIRVRFTNEGDCLTLKHRIPKAEYKAATEEEYTVDGKKTTQELLDQGLSPKWAKYKRRISYRYKGILFDMDMYPGIPPLLEIEAGSLQEIREGVKLLGLEQKNTATCGARGLFKRYNRIIDRFPMDGSR